MASRRSSQLSYIRADAKGSTPRRPQEDDARGLGHDQRGCSSPTTRSSALVRRAARRILPIVYRDDRVECNCCDRRFRAFIERYGGDTLCPSRFSLRRHRLLLLYLLRETAVGEGACDLLHVAPEEGLQEKLTALLGARYVSVDASPVSVATVQADVTALPFDAQTFDLVICSHVLEHVVDDHGALRELLRVLRPGGSALLLQPVHDEIPVTVEDPTITDPKDRLRAFGQKDHVRIYGHDFVPRVESVGFEVEILDYLERVDAETIAPFELGPERLYVAKKKPY